MKTLDFIKGKSRLSDEQIAVRIGFSAGYLSQVRRNKKKRPSRKLLEALNRLAEQLMANDGAPLDSSPEFTFRERAPDGLEAMVRDIARKEISSTLERLAKEARQRAANVPSRSEAEVAFSF